MTIDEAIAEVYKRVHCGDAADHAVPEIRLQIGQGSTSATISRDTFSQIPRIDNFYGHARTPVEAIMAAIIDAEEPHSSDCAKHNAPAMVAGDCDCDRDTRVRKKIKAHN